MDLYQSSIKIITETISRDELKKIAEQPFGDLVKAVVDIARGIMAIGGELHVDEEQVLLEQGSKQEDVWGINLYPDKSEEDWVEFDSMINIRPRQGNRSRGVEDSTLRQQILEVVRMRIV